jgi:hypothetical protein
MVSTDHIGLWYMRHWNLINNTSITFSSIGITFIEGELEECVMPRNESNKVQTGKLKGKFIHIYQQYGILRHAKINCFNLGNGVSNKNQDLDYKLT